MKKIIKQIKKQLKEDLPKMDLRKLKLEIISIDKMFLTFEYEGKKFRYNYFSKWLELDDGLARPNLRKEFQ